MFCEGELEGCLVPNKAHEIQRRLSGSDTCSLRFNCVHRLQIEIIHSIVNLVKVEGRLSVFFERGFWIRSPGAGSQQ